MSYALRAEGNEDAAANSFRSDHTATRPRLRLLQQAPEPRPTIDDILDDPEVVAAQDALVAAAYSGDERAYREALSTARALEARRLARLRGLLPPLELPDVAAVRRVSKEIDDLLRDAAAVDDPARVDEPPDDAD